MEAPTQDLSKFSHEDLLQFAKDSQSNNEYQQRVIDSFSDVLTKREHFAGLVIVPSEVLCKALVEQNPQGFTPDQYIEAAVMYKIREADALLKELDK